MGSVGTILQADNKTRVARAEYRSAKAKTENTNRLEVGKSGLANFMRSASNKAKATAASKEYNFQMDQLSDELRAKTGAGMNSQLQLATARGALAAQSGYVGVGGSSVDLMDSMVRLQNEMDEESRQNATKLLASRGAQQTAQIMSNSYGNMDLSQNFGSFDYSQHIEPKAMGARFGKLVAVAVATYFGGPMAGEAVADLAVGEWQAKNGNFDGANESFGQAASGAMGAYKSWGQRGGQSWGSAVREGSAWGSGGEVNITTTGQPNYGGFAPTQTSYGTTTSGLGWFDNPGNRN